MLWVFAMNSAFLYVRGLRLFQLGVFLDQLFQTELGKLYKNLRVGPIALALEYRPFTVLGMTHALSGAESGVPGGFWGLDFWPRKPLPTRGKELRDVVDGVICRSAVRTATRCLAARVSRTLVLVFVGVVPAAPVVAGVGVGRPARRVRGPQHAPVLRVLG